ncbi:transcription antitermination factor NusB [Tabrizicola sp.]|jgi:16S rRNA (cytosine967-C5)-methyltransferase|uniref:RsmB/NOP family class I SAM-dependent RNA methyltransferase n=1 Tax=Tabrizicola sp. TaxID=2005166 RepID=UPI001A468925|nr:transcription antitermination factor NusB [Tabrizicola sp.]MBL9063465.1 methyltransferase domain-containing protein [Tabrizicola sp.]
MAEGVVARATAVAILDGVLGEGRMLSDFSGEGLAPADRARALRLAETVLRQLEPADKLLDKHLRKSPPLTVRNTLRLAVVERAEGAPAHGVVNAAVEITRKGGKRSQHLAGLVNAVLRALPETLTLPVQKLPRWLRQPLVHTYGRDTVTAIEAVQAQEPPLDLTLRPGFPHPEGDLLPTGSLRLRSPGQLSTLPGYAEGGWWVQDAAAALPARLLDPHPGEHILDLCAAPGGKTLQLAASGAHVTALDISAPRMARLQANLARTGLAATLVTADALHWQPEAPFDAILLDAPCSATGTIRRHPDLPFVKDGSELPSLTALQSTLVDRALGWLKPAGRLVFSTCSLLPEEGEAQLAATLVRHPRLTIERPDLPGIDPSWWTPENALRLRPDFWAERGGMDGFFLARLRKPG